MMDPLCGSNMSIFNIQGSKKPVHCLFISSISNKKKDEYEVLLSRNIKLSFLGKFEKYVLDKPDYYFSLGIFFEAKRQNIERAQVIELGIYETYLHTAQM